ncbi:MAG: hypothetical protein OCU12_07150 [Methanophagales archaeon]|nr:hypothetical protein [Methanophagales archaeon]
METPKRVPINVPLGRLATMAYYSYAVTKLKATTGLLDDTPPEQQVPDFKTLTKEEQTGWLAAVQSIMQNTGGVFALRNPAEVAVETAQAVVDEIIRQYPIRQTADEIRFPVSGGPEAYGMWGRAVARILRCARLVIPAIVARGQLKGLIPRNLSAEERAMYGIDGLPKGIILIPGDLYEAMIRAGYEDGEKVTFAVMDPNSDMDVSDGLLQPAEGDLH